MYFMSRSRKLEFDPFRLRHIVSCLDDETTQTSVAGKLLARNIPKSFCRFGF